MLIKNVTKKQLDEALALTNKQFEGNICFNRFDPANEMLTRWNVTLYTNDSKKPGHRLGFPRFTRFGSSPDYTKRRRLRYACWHVHGCFFDNLIAVAPDVAIKSTGSSLAHPNAGSDGWITKDGGNWQDWDIGSQLNPYYMSEACDCGE